MYIVSNKLVVTRHKALYDYLIEKNIVGYGTPCIAFARPSDLSGKHVYGVLPFWLASKADIYTEIQLRLPLNKKGKELSIEDIRFLAVQPRTYKVREVPNA